MHRTPLTQHWSARPHAISSHQNPTPHLSKPKLVLSLFLSRGIKSKTDPFRSLSLLNVHKPHDTFHGKGREKTPPLIPEKKTRVRTETKVYGHSTTNGTEVVAMEESQEKEVIKEDEEVKRKQVQLKWGLKEKVCSVVAAQFLLYTLVTLAYALAVKYPQFFSATENPYVIIPCLILAALCKLYCSVLCEF